MTGRIGPEVRTFPAIGTTATVAVTDRRAADAAEALLRADLRALDEACSRFRRDSEIQGLYGRGGAPVAVSELLFEVVSTACDVARATAGAVDPTVGRCLEALGYDRDYRELAAEDPPADDGEMAALEPAPGWWTVGLDHRCRTVSVPSGVRIDVGSSAKALAADRAAGHIAARTGSGTLVSIGGDVAVAGPSPDGGWPVGIAVDSSTPRHAVDQVVAIASGGVASSSPGVRSWRRRGRTYHHIVDPRTGDCAVDHWTLVSVAAPTCVEANALTTAAVVWAASAAPKLAAAGRPARLVGPGGEVVTLHGWPADPARPAAAAAAAPGGGR